MSKIEFSASFTEITSLPLAIPPNSNPKEYLKLFEKIEVGVVDDNVAVPPVISKIKSEVSNAPLPLIELNTFSLKVISKVRLSEETSVDNRLALTVPSLTELLL